MGINPKLKREILLRSSALSVPMTLVRPFMDCVLKWLVSSGEAWTVDRLKTIKLDLLRTKAGMPISSSWIAYNHLNHRFKGPVGALQRWMSQSETNFSRGLQLLQVYTSFQAKVATPKQVKKFLDGVQSRPPTLDSLHLASEVVKQGLKHGYVSPRRWLRKPSPIMDFDPSPSKRAPLPDMTVPEVRGSIDSLRYLFEMTEGHQHYLRYKETHYRPVMGDLWDLLVNPEGRCYNRGVFRVIRPHGSFLVGRIGLIQEPGYKLRAVANPGRVFQVALQPLGEAIYDSLKTLPWDCTFDQTKAIPALQNSLARGSVVHSIDLSGATDYFPLALQEVVLNSLFPERDVSLFKEISQGSWFMPGFGEISWTRGQPLGLFPSFSAFALTHGLMLLGLLERPWKDDFFVLGDDVVITDSQLATRYHTCLRMMGCPVSEPKTLTSSSLCEFAGKIISSTKVIPQLKWRQVSDNSFVDVARLLGPRSTVLFRSRQQRVLRHLAEIPEFLGGLGWNSGGKPLEDRIRVSWLWDLEEPVDHRMSYSALRTKNLLSSRCVGLVTFGENHRVMINTDGHALDQRAVALVKDLIGSSFGNFPIEILGKNVDQVSLVRNGLRADLPVNTTWDFGERPSTLRSWESRIRHCRQLG